MTPVITLDGPAGVGKSTLAQALARYFGFTVLASGSIYRLIGLYALQHSLLESPRKLIDYAGSIRSDNLFHAVAEVGDRLHSKDVASAASRIATIPELRAALLNVQRNCVFAADIDGLVAEGRDMGTVVFPDAPCKLFITASPKVRALRRCKQMGQEPKDPMLAEITAQIIERDDRDSNRAVAPLVPASDAEVIDTSEMSLNEVVEALIALIQKSISL